MSVWDDAIILAALEGWAWGELDKRERADYLKRVEGVAA